MDTKSQILDELSLSNVIDSTELIPLMTEEDEERLNAEEMPNTLAILPLRNTVLFLERSYNRRGDKLLS